MKIQKLRFNIAVFFKMIADFFFNSSQRGKLRSVVLSQNPKPFSRPAPPPPESVEEKTYRNLICVDGHGHSGGGAAVDFLREFDNITVHSTFDTDGTVGIEEITKARTANTEIKILTDSNGLLDLELILTQSCSGTTAKSEAINRFISINEMYYVLDGGLFNDEYMKSMWEFVDSLVYYKTFSKFPVSFRALSPNVRYANIVAPTLSWPHKEGYYFFPKVMTSAEFRKKAALFLSKVLRTIESKEYLMLDSLISCSGGADYAMQQEYVPGIKTVFMYRDPRDVYATACRFDLKWMPKDDINAYVTWVKIQRSRFRLNHPDILAIRFEDLVLNYDVTTKKIMDFFGLYEKNHVYQKKFFDTAISQKNVGLYKTLASKENEIKIIEKELGEYCVENN